ncbi:hypothetical protein BGX31_003611 [Mortierella sp. GBA43]|nr:hypothetical protein BGX31_003611 [Mortierella sp. GBA43]
MDAPVFGTPFRRVSRPITIQVDVDAAPSSPSSASSSTLALLIEQTEKREQYFRQFEQQHQEEFARLQQEQDELEKVEQDRDQLLDNEEEEQLDQAPETVRRRQEESLGLWMTDAEFEALGGRSQQDDEYELETSEEEELLLHVGNSRFDLYAEDFQEVTDSELPTEEEMLRWPITNLSQFEDRQDEVQDEYDDQV